MKSLNVAVRLSMAAFAVCFVWAMGFCFVRDWPDSLYGSLFGMAVIASAALYVWVYHKSKSLL
jgi:hypothetical protein